MGRDFRIGDLAQIVLSLFGAMPLPVEDNPSRNLGQISGFTGSICGARAARPSSSRILRTS